MALTLTTETLALHTRHPFIIARGGQSDYHTLMVRIADGDGVEGWGEAAATRFYGETLETVVAALATYAPLLGDDPRQLESIERNMETALRGNAAARVAISTALHDLVTRRLGVPLWQWWGLDPERAPRSTFTIGMDTPEVMRRKVREAAGYPILKVKLGSADDLLILRTIREATDGEVRVDANGAWTPSHAVAMLPVLAEFGVTVLEQPVAAGDIAGLGHVRRHARIPVIADESCVVAADIPRLAGLVDGINIKLAKCGSLREALRMIAVARAHGMMVMIGCMIESSIGITAAAHLSPLVDIVDLDGAALLDNDPFIGATIDGGQVTLPTGPGLGVTRR
ncbi:MAG TPA: dipeptide epimerase [Gemmatimonadales bacterium]|jgi:L-alanine-DL-glutamate epimerase-like enolase superfamily enzyme|nr:dipeptide epimerase [Gemmatimonadales bacterium]